MRLDEKGYTLIELLAAITILLIVLVPFTSLFFQGFKTNVENTKLLDTKVIATGIIEELKVGVIESSETVEIGGEYYDISDPNLVIIDSQQINIDGENYIISFTITNYPIPDEMLTGIIAAKPNNLYKITLELIPEDDTIDYHSVQLKTIIKR